MFFIIGTGLGLLVCSTWAQLGFIVCRAKKRRWLRHAPVDSVQVPTLTACGAAHACLKSLSSRFSPHPFPHITCAIALLPIHTYTKSKDISREEHVCMHDMHSLTRERPHAYVLAHVHTSTSIMWLVFPDSTCTQSPGKK